MTFKGPFQLKPFYVSIHSGSRHMRDRSHYTPTHYNSRFLWKRWSYSWYCHWTQVSISDCIQQLSMYSVNLSLTVKKDSHLVRRGVHLASINWCALDHMTDLKRRVKLWTLQTTIVPVKLHNPGLYTFSDQGGLIQVSLFCNVCPNTEEVTYFLCATFHYLQNE